MNNTDSNNRETPSGSLLVVNLRGIVNTRTPVRTTLEQLSIARRFNATIVPDNEVYRGMLNISKDHVAWCKIESTLAEKLLKTRSEKASGVKFSEEGLKRQKEFRSYSELANGLESGKAKLSELGEMRPFFRLKPPRGGFRKSTRRQYRDGGILGKNEELPKLVERML